MKATGIVVEYNPLHNGHVYHAQQAKAATDADVIIAVMSGNFLQRGEPAFVDKWTRTRMALQADVDIVFELPYRFATGHATIFAEGAIRLLDAAGCSFYCFGSEDGEISTFTNSLELINRSNEKYENAVKLAVQEGISYPAALNRAYDALKRTDESDIRLADLSKPNNILGFHYMQAAQTIKSKMIPTTVQRLGADYHEETLDISGIASATGIRKSYFTTTSLDDLMDFIPRTTGDLLSAWQKERQQFGNWEQFYTFLRYIILREGPERLSTIADITEGIENSLYRAALKNDSFQSFMHDVKSKRYTWTRIQRMLTHVLNGFTVDMRKTMKTPAYLRLLGMTDNGRRYLNERKKNLSLPLVSKVAAFSDPSLEMDIRASDIYALAIGQGSNATKVGLDYSIAPFLMSHFSSKSFK